MSEHWAKLLDQFIVLAITLITLWLRQSIMRVKKKVTDVEDDVQIGRAVRNVTLGELRERIEELEHVCGVTYSPVVPIESETA